MRSERDKKFQNIIQVILFISVLGWPSFAGLAIWNWDLYHTKVFLTETLVMVYSWGCILVFKRA